jgi:diacylglycerol kinase family enzyme
MSSSTTRLVPYLASDRDVHVVLSILSGRHDAQAYFDQTLKPVLNQHLVSHTVHTTTSAKSISQLCTSRFIPAACKGVKQTILLLSGDGGVIDIANTIATSLMRDTYDHREASVFVKPVICLFPLGTANALATSAGISVDPISTLLTGRPRPLPIFEARFSKGGKLVTEYGQAREPITHPDDPEPRMYGAVVFSWGLHASLVATSDTPEYRKHGVERFKMAAQELLKESHVYKGKVRIKRDRYGDFEDLVYPALNTASNTESETDRSAGTNSSTTNTNTTPPSSSPDEHIYILAPLVSSLEPSFLISPHTQTPSNTLRLLAIAPSQTGTQAQRAEKNSAELMRILSLAYQNGAHVSAVNPSNMASDSGHPSNSESDPGTSPSPLTSNPEPSIIYTPIDSLRIQMHESDEVWRQVCIDGKIIAVNEGGWVHVNMLPAMGMDGRRVVEVVCPV